MRTEIASALSCLAMTGRGVIAGDLPARAWQAGAWQSCAPTEIASALSCLAMTRKKGARQ